MGFLDRVKGAAESAQAATSKFGVGASAGQMGLANKAQRLTKVGVDTPAHIDAMTSTGNTDTPGGTEYDISLTVSPGRRRRLSGDHEPVHLPVQPVRSRVTT